MEFHAFAQMEDIDLAVLQDLPGLGQVWYIVQVGIDGDQAVEQIAHSTIGLDARGEMGVQSGDIRFPRNLQGTSRPGLLGPDRQRYEQEQAGYSRYQPAAALVSLHELPSSQLFPPIDMSLPGSPLGPGCIDSRRLLLVWKQGSVTTGNQPGSCVNSRDEGDVPPLREGLYTRVRSCGRRRKCGTGMQCAGRKIAMCFMGVALNGFCGANNGHEDYKTGGVAAF